MAQRKLRSLMTTRSKSVRSNPDCHSGKKTNQKDDKKQRTTKQSTKNSLNGKKAEASKTKLVSNGRSSKRKFQGNAKKKNVKRVKRDDKQFTFEEILKNFMPNHKLVTKCKKPSPRNSEFLNRQNRVGHSSDYVLLQVREENGNHPLMRTSDVMPELSLQQISHHTRIINSDTSQPTGFEGTPHFMFGINWYGNIDKVMESNKDDVVKRKKKKTIKITRRANTNRSKFCQKRYSIGMLGEHADVNTRVFNRLQDVIFNCLLDTVKETGWETDMDREENEHALGYLEGILSTCSTAQRKALIENGGKKSPLFCACESGNVKLLRFFDNCCDLEIKCTDKCLLMAAIMRGQLEVVEFLITCDKKVPCPVDGYATPLVVACGGYPIDFEERGVTIEPKVKGFPDDRKYNNKYYQSFVQKYKDHVGNLDMVKLLITNGALVDAHPVSVFNCFKYCIDKQKWDILKLLIENTENIDVRNTTGCSALGYAVEKMDLKAVKILITNGADINDTRMLINTRFSATRNDNSNNENEDEEPKENVNISLATRQPRSKKPEHLLNDGSVPKPGATGKVEIEADKCTDNKTKKCRIGRRGNKTKVKRGKQTSKGKTLVVSDGTKESRKSKSKDIKDKIVYVHPVVYVATKQNHILTYYLLNNDSIPFSEKMNALDVIGAKIAMAAAEIIDSEFINVYKESNAAFRLWETASLQRWLRGTKKENIAKPRDYLYKVTEMKYYQDRFDSNSIGNTLVNAYLVHERLFGYKLDLTMAPFKKLVEFYFEKGRYFEWIRLLSAYFKEAFIGCDENSSEYEEAVFLLKRCVTGTAKFIQIGLYDLTLDDIKTLCEAVFNAGFKTGTATQHVTGFACPVHDCLLIMIDYLMLKCNFGILNNDILDFVKNIVKSDPRCNHMETLLHKAVRIEYDSWAFYDMSVVDYEDVPRCGNSSLVLLLLDLGADVHARDQDGNTPFHILCKDYSQFPYEFEEHSKTIEYLSSFGGKITCENKQGETPMSLSSTAPIRLELKRI